MPTPDELLAALDPEQRQVAEAIRGPVRVLAGAGHRQDPGDHAPDRLRRRDRGLRPDRGPRRHLHDAGGRRDAGTTAETRRRRSAGPDVPLRGAAPAALLLAPRARPRAARADRLQDRTAGRSRPPSAGPDRPGAAARPRQRGRVGQGQQRLARRLRPGRRRSAAAPSPSSMPTSVARIYEGYEEIKRGQTRMDMEDVLLFAAGLLADEEAVAAQVRRQYKWLVVDEFQDVSPLQSALLDLWLGGRDEICVVGDPAQTIYSFAGANASYLRDFAKKYPATTSRRAGAQLPIDAADRRRRQPDAGRHAAARASTSSPSRPAGPEVTYAPTPTRSPRRPPPPTGSPPCALPAPPPARSPSSSGSTPSPRRSRTP